jgi:hypothetical protein
MMNKIWITALGAAGLMAQTPRPALEMIRWITAHRRPTLWAW